LPLTDTYWREKTKTACPHKIAAHCAIIASKSSYFHKLFIEKATNTKEPIVIDFGEAVMYEAFRKIADYFYLDDISVLESISDSQEMLEIIKLSKLFKLNDLFRAAECHF